MKKTLLTILVLSTIGTIGLFSTANAFYRYTPTPRPAPTPTASVATGDAALIAATKKAFGTKYKNSMSVAFVDLRDNTTRYANLNANDTRHYEVGSITKAIQGNIYADAIARGEVTPTQKIGTLLPIPADKPFYHVTLDELATHRSGLPTFSTTSDMTNALRQSNYYGTDPTKSFTKETVYTHAISSYNAANRGKYIYSNVGLAALGHALAVAAQSPSYKQLQQDRMFTPLNMTNSIFPETAANLPAGSPLGKNSRGKTIDAWTLNGYAPAGGIRSDLKDISNFTKRLLQNNVIGMDALNARYQANNGQYTFGQAYSWEVYTNNLVPGRTVTVKTGMTGGFASIIMLDRSLGTAVVVLSNTAVPIHVETAALMKVDGK